MNADFDAILADFTCWNCGRGQKVEIQTKLHQGRRHRTLGVGDELRVGDPGDRESFFYEIVLNPPEEDGTVNAAYDWRCDKCKLTNWACMRVAGHKLAGVEPLMWDEANVESVNLIDAGALTSYLFRDAGMDCWINQITLEVHARRKKGSSSVEPYKETLSNMLPGRFRTLLASARFNQENPYKKEEYVPIFAYNEQELKRELINTARMYRAYPADFPRYVPASL
ncbi:MAG: hypothetical protein FJZ01_12210 [Candidatus Sericytochromatia bacterium]|nr:hypothetical protein [Candidatus Tanganyikabacteria bacterium]